MQDKVTIHPLPHSSHPLQKSIPFYQSDRGQFLSKLFAHRLIIINYDRHELLTSPPQTDVKSLSSSVNIVRDCPDLPVVLPPDLDIGTVPEISDEDDDFPDLGNTSPTSPASPSSLLSMKGSSSDNDLVRELLPTMIEA
jgi:hypothetical protein